MAARKGGLGKGLEALFTDNSTGDVNSSAKLRLSQIEPNKSQPRKDFDEEALASLADSIREHGIIQPLLVRPLENGAYQLVAGERRWRAARMAGISEVPVIIKELSDQETMEIGLIENLQREDLNPIEEALGYQTLMETYEFTQDDISKRVGRSRPAVANALRLLHLPEEVMTLVRNKDLSSGHARAILALPDEETMIEIAKKAAKGRVSVRDIERMAQEKKPRKEKPTGRDSFYDEVELALSAELGRKIAIQVKNPDKDRGTITLEFYNKEELADIANRLAGTER
ncbi:ParB/RepB/Spo0J family partition protein [Zongyangia hominis]|uniref:ParB/RepB/Spo0J family partition protein n=1 Tax=Zongyangia hominis TaxID=2763677 RepID=A0A926EB51_9FIRM|nr:ParB/RepB/Spo0J family partition protein [Zongyangia hominis]MBC8570652.1 ParB/RepB/Spo0J family partition protein [Zongyangia hominis]